MFLVAYEYSDWDSHSYQPLFLVETEDEAEYAIIAMEEEIKKVRSFYTEYPHQWKKWNFKTRKEYSQDYEKYEADFKREQAMQVELAREIFKVYPGIQKDSNGDDRISMCIPCDRSSFVFEEVPVKKVEI